MKKLNQQLHKVEDRVKDRVLNHRQMSITAVALLAFLTVAIWRYPSLIEKPETLVALAAGLVPLFLKDSK
jgi:hypothetical protein